MGKKGRIRGSWRGKVSRISEGRSAEGPADRHRDFGKTIRGEEELKERRICTLCKANSGRVLLSWSSKGESSPIHAEIENTGEMYRISNRVAGLGLPTQPKTSSMADGTMEAEEVQTGNFLIIFRIDGNRLWGWGSGGRGGGKVKKKKEKWEEKRVRIIGRGNGTIK